MENFIAYNPTKIHFGKDVTDSLGEVVKQYGNNVLLIYGKGSVIKYGYYDRIIKPLKAIKVKITEYSGIKPNPVVEDVDSAVELSLKENVEMIVALGGGSVIDTAKIISLCIPGRFKGWDVMKRKVEPSSAIPLIAVLTLAATGTEMNGAAVIQNHTTQEKIGYVNELAYPRHSFLDPQFTATVPFEYTSFGIVDLIAHALEAYFGKGDVSLSDRIVFSIIKDAMHYAPLLLNDLENYEYRANIMLDATCALNGMTNYGRKSGDWGVHAIGHQLSLLYDVPHGASLSIAYPAWLRLHKNRIPDRILQLGEKLFNTNSVEKTIEQLIKFFVSVKSPVHLTDIGIGNSKKAEIIELMNKNKITGLNHNLSKEDHASLVNYMM
ncbi:MAG: iron-containing alcohol dehydrogenase [Bacteroidales bacterium]|nr:iron-containing alcohol dehydrogenase [Bacteroidales bacterium]